MDHYKRAPQSSRQFLDLADTRPVQVTLPDFPECSHSGDFAYANGAYPRERVDSYVACGFLPDNLMESLPKVCIPEKCPGVTSPRSVGFRIFLAGPGDADGHHAVAGFKVRLLKCGPCSVALEQSALLESFETLKVAGVRDRIRLTAQNVNWMLVEPEAVDEIGAGGWEPMDAHVARCLNLRIPVLRGETLLLSLMERRICINQVIFTEITEAY